MVKFSGTALAQIFKAVQGGQVWEQPSDCLLQLSFHMMHAAALQSAARAQLNQCSQVHQEHALCTNAWKSAHTGDLQAERMVIDNCGDLSLCAPLAGALQDFRQVSCDFQVTSPLVYTVLLQIARSNFALSAWLPA